jgi:large subunit ribosomal protein L3
MGCKTKMGRLGDPFTKGKSIPVTFIEVSRCEIINKKTSMLEGYNSNSTALTIKYEDARTRAIKYTEFPVDASEENHYRPGTVLGPNLFLRGEHVKIQGTLKGKGFLGNQKRNNFQRGPMTHGSKNHRFPGSIGAGSTPANVNRGKKMPGRLGRKMGTSTNAIVGVVQGKQLQRWTLIVKGSVPGDYNNAVKITRIEH